MKKVLSLLLSAVLLLSCFTVTAVSANAATKPVPGYYVVGTMNNWTLDKDYLMQPSYFDNHYELLQTPLKVGEELKIVFSEDGIGKTKWYPEGVDNNFIVTESNDYYNIELAPDYDGVGDFWYADCIRAMPCPPPIEDPNPTEPEPVNHTRELWERGAVLTAEDIEEAANEQYNSRIYFFADEIHLYNTYRFNCTPAYIVDFGVDGYGLYCEVITEAYFGDYLFYSTSSYEPSIFADNKLYRLTDAYEAGILTQEMLAELVEADYKGGGDYSPPGSCRIITRNIKGDADGNGECDIIDATVIQRYNASIISAYDFYKPLGDVDGDSDVTVIDATLIQRKEAGMYTIA